MFNYKPSKRMFLLILIFSIIPNLFFGEDSTKPIAATKDTAGNLPSDAVKTLAQSYQECNFKGAQEITTGKMASIINQVIQVQKSNSGKIPTALVAFSQQIDTFKILGEIELKNSAIVSSSWIFKLPEKYNPKIFYKKVSYVDYFLEKDNTGQWKVSDAKFKNEKIYYNKAPRL